MTVAWGVLVPIGILLALFYKVVWPEGEWFYVSGWSSRLSFNVVSCSPPTCFTLRSVTLCMC